MRKTILARLVFAVSAVCGIGVWVACGGSDDQDVVNRDAGFDSSRAEERDADQTPRDSGPVDSGPVDSGPTYDPGEEVTIYPDGGDDAGIPCFAGGEIEVEPNDDKDDANEFDAGVRENSQRIRRILCGAAMVTDGGADGGESDWLKFELSDASTGFYIQYFGDLRVNVETDGQAPVDITQRDASLGPHRVGQPYFVEVKSASGRTEKWKIVVYESRPAD